MRTYLLPLLLLGAACDDNQPTATPTTPAAAQEAIAKHADSAPQPPAIDPPSDVAAPPADASKSASGLA
ncbi:MAG: peptidylprolyl isomerase, partial [Deltaproteobacteria bacterium]